MNLDRFQLQIKEPFCVRNYYDRASLFLFWSSTKLAEAPYKAIKIERNCKRRLVKVGIPLARKEQRIWQRNRNELLEFAFSWKRSRSSGRWRKWPGQRILLQRRTSTNWTFPVILLEHERPCPRTCKTSLMARNDTKRVFISSSISVST